MKHGDQLLTDRAVDRYLTPKVINLIGAHHTPVPFQVKVWSWEGGYGEVQRGLYGQTSYGGVDRWRVQDPRRLGWRYGISDGIIDRIFKLL